MSRAEDADSVASGDPSCDWPTLLHTLDSEIHSKGPGGERSRSINGFVRDLYETELEPGEVAATGEHSDAHRVSSSFSGRCSS